MEEKTWVNILKGIGIITVVAGHTFNGLTKDFIFLFHMPLFFFIGGYLFNKKTNLSNYLKSKIQHLIVPYFSYIILIYFPFQYFENNFNNYTDLLIYLIRPLIGGQALYGASSVFWFVTCYFFTQQFFNLLVNKFSFSTTTIISILLLFFGYVNSIIFPKFWLPGNLNVVFVALPFLYVGYLFKKYSLSYKLIILLPLVILTIIGFYYLENNTIDLKYSKYGIPFLSFLSGIIIILFLKECSVLLSKYKMFTFIMVYIGKASMTIMYLHIPVKILIINFLNLSQVIVFLISLIIPFFLHLLFLRFEFLSTYLLGIKKKSNTLETLS